MRRATIIVTVAVIAVSLGVGIYLVSTAGNSSIDAKVGQPVSSSDFDTLYHASLQPYGPAPPLTLASQVINASGEPFTSGGKPVVVYVGAEFCPFCAIQRWSLIMALMRFGNFTDLTYMASSPAEGDLATFTFLGSSYHSNYLVFQPFENEDRNHSPLQSVPANYSAEWQTYGNKYPFMNFGNRYIIPSSTMLYNDLQGKNWTRVLDEINAGDAFGVQIKQSANLLSALICKITGDLPSSVCTVSPIQSTESGTLAPTGSTQVIVGAASRDIRRAP
jgi:thiol-disulfide isomerase/thioredoxin